MKSLAYIFLSLILLSCAGPEDPAAINREQNKEEVFSYILKDDLLSQEMADSLIRKHPDMVREKLNIVSVPPDGTKVDEEMGDSEQELAPFEENDPIKENESIIKSPVKEEKKVIEKPPVKKETVQKEEEKKEEVKKEEPEVTNKEELPKEDPVQEVEKNYKLKSGELKIKGTSTLHDWEMVATIFSVDAKAGLLDKELKSIKSIGLSLPVNNLKSDEKKMNDIAWDALKADQHKNITFRLSNATVSQGQGNSYNVKASGKLTIAGVTKNVDLDATGIMNDLGYITFSGSEKINMTDYEVKPPTFMLGAMKTGEVVDLIYKVTLE